MDDSISSQQPGQYRSACAECHRRKQKCNREWPCNHCQKRKVADKCRFILPHHEAASRSPSDSLTPKTGLKRSRSREHEEVVDAEDADNDIDLAAMGYGAGPLFESLSLGPRPERKPANDLMWVEADKYPQLQHALSILPPRPQMDALVQSFFNTVNYHYYIIYPPTFLEEYQKWWERRSQNRPLALQWTILLIMVCSCAAQHLDADAKPLIEAKLGESSEKLTKDYHDAAQDLGRLIPAGHCHLLNIQWMLHSIYWYKAEAKFVEAWHVIGSACREAHELGLHRLAASEDLSEFEKEMRRRVWVVLDCWDWQFASGLQRPTIIDHTDINVEPPRMTLEDWAISPLLHMKLQSDLITELAKRWGAPKNIQTPADIQEYVHQIEAWMVAFPPVYQVSEPDTSYDQSNPWVVSHRFYIHTMAYLMILNPMRTYMSQPFSQSTPDDKQAIRSDAIYYSLRNLNTTGKWAEMASHRDGRFHFIIFSLFDTAAVLSTALIKDQDGTIPCRDEITEAVDNAVVILRRLKALSKTAKTSHDILVRMIQRIPRRPIYDRDNRKKPRLGNADMTAQVSGPSPPTNPAGSATHHSPLAHVYAPSLGSQSASPSTFASPASAATGSTPQSQCTSNYESFTADIPPPNPPYRADPANYPDYSYHHEPVPMEQPLAPNVAIEGVLQAGAVDYDALASMADPNNMVPPPGMMMAPNNAYANYHALPDDTLQYGFGNITEAELGDFSNLWDWRSLNLDFITGSK